MDLQFYSQLTPSQVLQQALSRYAGGVLSVSEGRTLSPFR